MPVPKIILGKAIGDFFAVQDLRNKVNGLDTNAK